MAVLQLGVIILAVYTCIPAVLQVAELDYRRRIGIGIIFLYSKSILFFINCWLWSQPIDKLDNKIENREKYYNTEEILVIWGY